MNEYRRSLEQAPAKQGTLRELGGAAVELAQTVEWTRLLEEALTMPGNLGNIYNRFYPYSFNNQVLLYMQRVTEPVATYNKWKEMGRQVQKGSKAKSILRPITLNLKDQLDKDGQPKKLTKFKMVKCLFTASETSGDELPEWEPPEWSAERALGALAISRVPFELLDGNVQGYSFDRNVTVSPVAVYPFKTLIHEVGHVVLGHTTPDQRAEYQEHRGVKEFAAESTAYLTLNEIGATDNQWNPSSSRAYIQTWLQGQRPPDQEIKAVFKATDAILKAGRSSGE
jgi:hypothetical protein